MDIEGRIVLGEESNAFRERVKALLAAGKKKIVLNLASSASSTSSGLGTPGGDVPQRAVTGRHAETRQPEIQVQGSAAGHQVDYRCSIPTTAKLSQFKASGRNQQTAGETFRGARTVGNRAARLSYLLVDLPFHPKYSHSTH